jgi:hypothetical protein
MRRAHSLAVARQRARALGEEKKAQASKYKTEIDEVETQIDQLAQVVKTKSEHRPVDCEWIEDHPTGMMRLVRLDTDTEVTSRAMTVAERQATLNFDKKVTVKDEAPKKRRGARKEVTETTPTAA